MRCEALGVARVLDAETVASQAVREPCRVSWKIRVSHRGNAERIRDEIAALPGPGSTP
jgi:hypothetical protein